MSEVTMASAAAALLVRENRTYPGTSTATSEDTTGVAGDASTSDDYLWWSSEDVMDEHSIPAMRLDGSEGGLWSGAFVPPPPRPVFLDEGATPDGLTTCDLCSWAWQGQGHRPFQHVDKATEAPGEVGWVLTLIIVSIISAAIGAVIMITALHCKRMKNGAAADSSQQRSSRQSTSPRNRPPMSPPSNLSTDKAPSPERYPAPHTTTHSSTARDSSGVWSWLTARRPSDRPSPLTASTLPAENHYTHMDENYSSVGEALYAELDRDSNSPAYQNSAYADPDAPTSSAPSSAYYSDLSVTTMPDRDRAYEVVGLNNSVTVGGVQCWDNSAGDIALRKQTGTRLAAISETVNNMPSDYV